MMRTSVRVDGSGSLVVQLPAGHVPGRRLGGSAEPPESALLHARRGLSRDHLGDHRRDPARGVLQPCHYETPSKRRRHRRHLLRESLGRRVPAIRAGPQALAADRSRRLAARRRRPAPRAVPPRPDPLRWLPYRQPFQDESPERPGRRVRVSALLLLQPLGRHSRLVLRVLRAARGALDAVQPPQHPCLAPAERGDPRWLHRTEELALAGESGMCIGGAGSVGERVMSQTLSRITAPPATVARWIASSRNSAPQSTPKTGTTKITVIPPVAPSSASSRK